MNSFDPFNSCTYPFPDLLGDNNFLRDNYESQGDFFPSKLLTPLANDSSQNIQSRFHQSFHHQTTSRKIINHYYGTSPANTGISLFANCCVQHIKGEDVLISKPTRLEEIRASFQFGGGANGKQRIRWTYELHEQFVDAVDSLGGPMKATPKGILKLMKMPALTIFHIKSHLQKYRTAKGIASFHKGGNGRSNCAGMSMPNLKGHGGYQISETLRLQMDVQRSLHEHLEFLKKLQLRIEEQANYLEKVTDQQKKSSNFFQGRMSDKVLEPCNGECSSTTACKNHGEIFLNEQKA